MLQHRMSFIFVSVFVLLLSVPVIAQDNLISLASSDMNGEFLVGPTGLTLYIYTRDPLGETVCYDQCAERWPPLIVDSADDVTVADGIPGEFSTVERTDGRLQVSFNGMPLYYFERDRSPGDTAGNGRSQVWWLLHPATVYAFRHGDLAPILVDSEGMTLYMFANDSDTVSNCYEQCAENWPPLLVESADELVKGVNLIGTLDLIERTDGSLQLSYNGMPLHHWGNDMNRGDMGGEGRGDVWFTIAPETLAVSNSDELGEFLVGANGMTLYQFSNDENGVSNCLDECAETWLPLLVNPDDALVGGLGVSGELGTLTRADESIQVTYNGMPLYYWLNDTMLGDTGGNNLGEAWFVVKP